jgi:hypothetical protein
VAARLAAQEGLTSVIIIIIIIIFYYWGETESTWYCRHYWPIVPTPDDTLMVVDYGTIGGMIIGRRNLSALRKPAPMPLCPPQIAQDLTRARIRTAAIGSQRLCQITTYRD